MVELELKDMLHLDVMTVTGKTLGENLEDLEKENFFQRNSGLSPQLRPGERTGDLPGGKSQGKGFCCILKEIWLQRGQ